MKTNALWLNALLLLVLFLPAGGQLTLAARPETAASVDVNVIETLRRTPVMFIENVGQFAEDARFQVHSGNNTLWLDDDALWITVLEPESRNAEVRREVSFPPHLHNPESEIQNRQGVNLRLNFLNANPQPRLEPFDRLETTVSYFLGSDPDGWRPAVPVWGGVRYVDLYPGIDLEVTSEGGELVQRLRARPGADLSQVQLRVEGAEAVAHTSTAVECADLFLHTAMGDFALPLPIANFDYVVEVADATQAVCTVMLRHAGAVGGARMAVAVQGNPNDLLYAAFLGGSDYDSGGYGITVDESGAAYVTGETRSSDFPTTPGTFTSVYNGGGDAFVAKIAPDGSTLAYAAFLGGSDKDRAQSIAVDGNGAAYITGETRSSNFPATSEVWSAAYNGGESDAFVVKVTPEGSALAYAAFLGGSLNDVGYGIAVDKNEAAYVTGNTLSSDFPATPGAFRTTLGGVANAFVAKVLPDGNALAYATFLGGEYSDEGKGIAVDSSGAAYVTGGTYSRNFVSTPGAFDTTYNGSYDAFVVKLVPDGSALAYATFLGGSRGANSTAGVDFGASIAVDVSGAAYVTGHTTSVDFPTTIGAVKTSLDGTTNAFVVKVVPDGSALDYATLLGGSFWDEGRGIAVDETGAAYITGRVQSSDFPVTPDAFSTTYTSRSGGNVFVAKMAPNGSALAYATFLGGSSSDSGYGIAVDASGTVFVTGYTGSTDFPVTPGAFCTTYNGGTDAFVVKLDMGGRAQSQISNTPTATPEIKNTPKPTDLPTVTLEAESLPEPVTTLVAPPETETILQEDTQNDGFIATLFQHPLWLIGIALGILGLFVVGVIALLLITHYWPSRARLAWLGCGVGGVLVLFMAAIAVALIAFGASRWKTPAAQVPPTSDVVMPTAMGIVATPADTMATIAPAATLPPATPTPKPSPTPESTATATLPPTSTEAPTATPTPTYTPTPTCPPVTGTFAEVWARNVQQDIGCKTGNAFQGFVAEEHFEGGIMFWREAFDQARSPVLFNNGTWRFYHHTRFVEGDPDFACVDANTPAQCPPTPIRGFGMMWCNIPELRERLGNAVDCERGYQATMQTFDKGFMLKNDHGTIYILFDDGTWQRQ